MWLLMILWEETKVKIEHIEIHESEHDLSEHVFCRGMNNLSAVEKETEKIQAWPGIEP